MVTLCVPISKKKNTKIMELAHFKVLFVVSFLSGVLSDRVVMTNNGPIQGITVSSEPEIEAFLGIPYAEPPVGRLRFMKPVPKTSWLGVYDASKLAPTCIQNASAQYYYMPNIDNMTEDCLYLNMWVPYSGNGTGRKPIIFFIHGGAFNIGSSNMGVYDGTKMVSRGDVIVVTINYRIGVMGFFSAFIEDADGNMGIYDQILALNWVRDNAESFGGDPDHIVLMGESAGAMSVAAHLVSPLTKNLIKRAILQSGAGLQPMNYDENERLYKASQKLATIVGCADKSVTLQTDPRIIVNCLKRLSAKELSAAEGILMKSNPITFVPRTGDTYMPRAIVYDVMEGNFKDTELLIGVNENEGSFFLSAAAPDYFGVYGVNNIQTLSRRLAYQMIRVMYRFTEQKEEGKIADFYINDISNGTSDIYTQAMSNSLGDYLITCGSVFHAQIHSLRNPVYFYVFSHRSSTSLLAEWMGTTHFDELKYIFGNTVFKNFTSDEEELSRRMMDRWLAFAKTG
ncbi:acetylcholinesterase-1-like, partial [Stegodyphus dumicola]|uniref:acetylcholinesterase-1-like n=1 Tax=Stegodyphus dumicola TaxID=202533 RepID=UPI0015AB582F